MANRCCFLYNNNNKKNMWKIRVNPTRNQIDPTRPVSFAMSNPHNQPLHQPQKPCTTTTPHTNHQKPLNQKSTNPLNQKTKPPPWETKPPIKSKNQIRNQQTHQITTSTTINHHHRHQHITHKPKAKTHH